MNNSTQPLSVVVVGSGNVAEAVARAVADTWALELKQVVARNAERAAAIAELCRTEWSDDFEKCEDADFYIIAVSDRAVAEVASQLRRAEGSIVVHTAGSVEMEALGGGARGVLYPFQTFTVGRKVDFSDVPLFVEGCSEEVTQRIEILAQALSSRVYRANSSRRREIHLSGVLACNFVPYIVYTDEHNNNIRLESNAILCQTVIKMICTVTCNTLDINLFHCVLLIFKDELVYLEQDYNTILENNYDFLEKIRQIRNKY